MPISGLSSSTGRLSTRYLRQPEDGRDKVLMGKDRVFNRRFQNLASHYLFEPVACTPAAGWEKGQVENQVGVVRQRFFVQRRRFADLDELNGWLQGQCRNHAATHKHPAFKREGLWYCVTDCWRPWEPLVCTE